MQSGWRGIRSASIAATLSLSLALSACGSTRSGAPSTTGTKAPLASTSIPATTTTTTTALGPTSAVVLNAYRASWAAFEHALTTANPSDPELAATMVDPQLQGVKANLFADKRAGMVARGTFTLHPKITALSATTATVVDCAYSTAELIYATSGKPVPPVTPPENDGVRATLVLSGSTWKVYKQTVTEGTCAPGS